MSAVAKTLPSEPGAKKVLTPYYAEYMRQLENLPIQAAKACQPFLEKAGIAEYKNFLRMMYHYTYRSEEKLCIAAEHSENEELKSFFLEMSHEERGHYLIAKADLNVFGDDISDDEPRPDVVERFDKVWDELYPPNTNGYLGALFVFENIAAHAEPSVRRMIDRLELTKIQARWLWVHLEADQEHGREVAAMCEQYIERDPDAMLAGAQKCCDAWIDVFTEALS